MSRIFGQFAVGGLSFLLSLMLHAEDAKPKIVFDEEYFDFGRVAKGQHLEHIFAFTNEGKGPLIIQKIDRSCSCLATWSGVKEIPPGGKGQIEVELRTGNRQRRITGSLVLYSNDPENPKVTLRIKAHVCPEIDMVPPAIYFHSVPFTRAFEKTIKIFIPHGVEVKLEKVESSSPYIEARLVKATENMPEDFQLEMKLKAGAPIGQFEGEISLITNSATWRIVHIPVIGNVSGEVECFPSRIFFGMVKKGSAVSRKTRIIIHAERPIKVVKAESDSNLVTVGIQPIDGAKEYWLTASLSRDAPVGMRFGKITIYTDSEYQPKLQIPFSGLIRDR